MWEIDIAGQIFAFLYSMLGGVIFCLIFDITRFIRKRFAPSNTAVFMMDIVYFIVLGFAEFCFFLATTNGEIRGFVFVGNIIGFAFCRFLLSGIFLRLLEFIYGIFDLVIGGFNRFVFAPIRSVFKKISHYVIKLSKKYLFFMKKGLKKPKRLVYTKEKCPQDTERKDVHA